LDRGCHPFVSLHQSDVKDSGIVNGKFQETEKPRIAIRATAILNASGSGADIRRQSLLQQCFEVRWYRRNRKMKLVEETLSNVREKTVAELVLAAQAGDREAFGELFERYRPAIVALAMRRVHNADEAEELAQDVFVQAMQKLQQLRVPEAFGGWLRRIVHRMAINRLTRCRAALACDPETLEATCLAVGSPDDIAQGREQAAVIRNGIDRLGALDQQTLTAFYLQSKSLIEMSDQFEAPVGTIKRRLHVARKRLAKEMDVMQAV
jgi:RNA polymerase sigma-70 factor (ECF subfamily)